MMSAWTSEENLQGRDKRFEDRFKVGRSVDGIRMTLRFLAFIQCMLGISSMKFQHSLITLCVLITK